MRPNLRTRLAILWFAIAVVACMAVMLQRMRGFEEAALTSDEGGPIEEREARPAPEPGTASPGGFMIAPPTTQDEMIGKLVFGLRTLVPAMRGGDLLSNAESLEDGTTVQQIAHAVLVGRLLGWEQGVRSLTAVEIDDDAPEALALRSLREDAVAALVLRAAIAERTPPDPTEDDARALGELGSRLEPSLGFYARLAVGDPIEESIRIVLVAGVVGGWYGLMFLGGVVALGLLAVLAATRRIRPAIAIADEAHAAIVLGEAFLLWLLLFLGLQVVVGIVLGRTGLEGAVPQLVASSLAMFASLVVVLYPLLRGVSLAQTRRLVGMHAGRGVLREAMHGVVCYASAIPLLVIGLVVFVVLSAIFEALFGKSPPPAHPAVDMLGGAGALQFALLFLLAVVAAPIVEEIAFRGFLYGHLRGVVAPRIRVLSMIVAAVASSFIFAVIHPQGVLFVPALGGLATGFCISRELRGSLVAPMVAHAINNAVTLGFGFLMFGS